MRTHKYRAWDKKEKKMLKPFDLEWLKFNTKVPEDFTKKALFSDDLIFLQYTGLKDKNGKESAHFDIANNKYLLYLDLVYGLYLIDISNGDIIPYKEDIINEITGNYFEQHEKISENCQRSINKLISQASRTM